MERQYITTNYAFIPAKRIKKEAVKLSLPIPLRSGGTDTLTLILGNIWRRVVHCTS